MATAKEDLKWSAKVFVIGAILFILFANLIELLP